MSAETFYFLAYAPTMGAEAVDDELLKSHRLFNALVEVERWRRTETDSFWARKGGYEAMLQESRDLDESIRAMRKGPAKKEALTRLWAMQRELATLRQKTEADALTTPEARRRKERAKEMRAEAKALGRKLSAAELSALLDREPDCVAPRDRIRLAHMAEREAIGGKVHPPTLAKLFKEAGLDLPTVEIDEEAKRRSYDAYKQSGVSQMSRALVTERLDRSVKMSEFGMPSFQRWEREGAIGVSFKASDDFREDQLFACEGAWARMERVKSNRVAGSRRADSSVRLWIRIGTDEKRLPIWACFPVYMYGKRQIPTGARITAIEVHRRREGVSDEWSVSISTDLDEPYRISLDDGDGTVAIDLTWRRMPDGTIRSGFWVGSDGKRGEIAVSDRILRKLDKFRDIRSIISRKFYWSERADEDNPGEEGGIVMDLHDWLQGNKDHLPEWLAEVAPYVRRCRDQKDLARLTEKWLDNRFDGDESVMGWTNAKIEAWIGTDEGSAWLNANIHTAKKLKRGVKRVREFFSLREVGERGRFVREVLGPLDCWRRQWRHLFEASEHGNASAIRAREDAFCMAAKLLTERYETIVVRDLDLAALKRRKGARDGILVKVEDAVRSVMTVAAPGELREKLVAAAKQRSRVLIKLDEPWLPTTCHACGGTCEWDRAAKLVHECEHCGAVWDQHENIARNMLRHCERSGEAKTPGGARKPRSAGNKGGESPEQETAPPV